MNSDQILKDAELMGFQSYSVNNFEKSFRILITINKPNNIKDYIEHICETLRIVSSSVFQAGNRILLGENASKDEKFYTLTEISKILMVSKGTVKYHTVNGNIKYTQKVPKGTIYISTTSMNAFVEKYTKYKNKWINRMVWCM